MICLFWGTKRKERGRNTSRHFKDKCVSIGLLAILACTYAYAYTYIYIYEVITFDDSRGHKANHHLYGRKRQRRCHNHISLYSRGLRLHDLRPSQIYNSNVIFEENFLRCKFLRTEQKRKEGVQTKYVYINLYRYIHTYIDIQASKRETWKRSWTIRYNKGKSPQLAAGEVTSVPPDITYQQK